MTIKLSIAVAAITGALLLHFLVLYGREQGCLSAGGKPRRGTLTMVCVKPATLDAATRRDLDAFLDFSITWLDALRRTPLPPDATPDYRRGLREAHRRTEDAKRLREALNKETLP